MGQAPSEVQLPVALASQDLHRLTILAELLLALWLLSGSAARLARAAAMVFFIVVAAVSLRMALEGQSSCGCFGRVVVHPWVTFGIDSVIATLLLGSMFLRSEMADSARMSISGTLLRGSGIAVVLIAVLMSAWGSDLSTVMARLRNQPLTMSPRNSAIGSGKVGEARVAQFVVENHSDRVVKLVGGSASCACATTEAMPCEIPVGGSMTIPVFVKFYGTKGRFRHSFYVYTDHPRQRKLTATFTGTVE